MNKLITQTLVSLVFGAVLLGLLLFLPAGTFAYWQAWLFMAVFLLSVNAIGVYLSLKDPALLERRKKVGPAAERSPAQQIIMTIAMLVNLGLLVFCALDYRFAWSRVPAWVSVAGAVMVALGLLINLLVFKANSYGGSNIQTYEDQQVITTGPYAVVRHPMYFGVLVMMVGAPLTLGSWWGLAVLALVVPGLVWRIFGEEKLLEKELPGYQEYAHKVRFRLVPYVW